MYTYANVLPAGSWSRRKIFVLHRRLSTPSRTSRIHGSVRTESVVSCGMTIPSLPLMDVDELSEDCWLELDRSRTVARPLRKEVKKEVLRRISSSTREDPAHAALLRPGTRPLPARGITLGTDGAPSAQLASTTRSLLGTIRFTRKIPNEYVTVREEESAVN